MPGSKPTLVAKHTRTLYVSFYERNAGGIFRYKNWLSLTKGSMEKFPKSEDSLKHKKSKFELLARFEYNVPSEETAECKGLMLKVSTLRYLKNTQNPIREWRDKFHIRHLMLCEIRKHNNAINAVYSGALVRQRGLENLRTKAQSSLHQSQQLQYFGEQIKSVPCAKICSNKSVPKGLSSESRKKDSAEDRQQRSQHFFEMQNQQEMYLGFKMRHRSKR
ncbi:hypothetical protein WN51_10798 [Melipona quadrifasciata]|uniref:Mos1 transposase HTH domain-containing protein n=1 Tax=Melipona quadrifasciata TaxID=166423 RepID=A0A0N0BHZ6_9HYME|nr:hypothetical protein WN51_10798 [Melipona quadrifasciata]